MFLGNFYAIHQTLQNLCACLSLCREPIFPDMVYMSYSYSILSSVANDQYDFLEFATSFCLGIIKFRRFPSYFCMYFGISTNSNKDCVIQ